MTTLTTNRSLTARDEYAEKYQIQLLKNAFEEIKDLSFYGKITNEILPKNRLLNARLALLIRHILSVKKDVVPLWCLAPKHIEKNDSAERKAWRDAQMESGYSALRNLLSSGWSTDVSDATWEATWKESYQ